MPIASSVIIDERVVVAGPDLDVELLVVEVQQEVHGRVQDHEIAEDDAGDEQERHHQQERHRDAPLLGLKAGSTNA